MTDLEGLKAGLLRAVDKRADALWDLALRIHATPELGFQEHQAQSWLTEPLTSAGFEIRKGIAGLETAFRASWGAKPAPRIALLAEYDAFPSLGHACGHNLVGASAVGAALALSDVCDGMPGRVEVIGCPAEEVFGGKVLMTERGAFDEVDAALTCHPLKRTMTFRPSLARTKLVLKFHGKASHASSAPWLGVSALDSLIQTFVGVSALRQFLRDGNRIHGIITHGGDAPNMIPEYAEGVFLVRAETMKEVRHIQQRVIACGQGQADASGARLEVEEGPAYAERVPNKVIADLYAKNLNELGREVMPATPEMGSSDVGNVGLVCPVVQANISCVPDMVSTHSREFAVAAASPAGMHMMLDGAKSLAMTVADLLYSPGNLTDAKSEWLEWKRRQSDHDTTERAREGTTTATTTEGKTRNG